MRGSFQIGKVFGIGIRIDYTWFVILALVILSLGGNYFPEQYSSWSDRYPVWSPALYWLMGIITALILFGSVLAHELAHSLVSKASGVPVESITLFILGGVARLSDEPKSSGSEFWMALAGPATSIGIGSVFWALYAAAGSGASPLAALAKAVMYANFAVAVFNLIPGFPLDGGRIFRSIVWKITGNLRKATRVASTLGTIIAYALIFLGVRIALSGDPFSGIWIAFIGWFLRKAASSSYHQLAAREMLRGVKVREVMIDDCPQLPGGLTVRDLVDEYALWNVNRCFPVVDDGHVRGIIAPQNIREVPRNRWETTRVREAMTPFDELKTIHPDDEVYDALKQMAEENVNEFPVVEDGQFIGAITRDNVMAFISVRRT